MKFIRFKNRDFVGYGSLEGKYVSQLNAPPWNSGVPINSFHAICDVTLLVPCQPSKIIALAINYPGVTGASSDVVEPKVFFKPPSSLIYNNEKIIAPFEDMRVWGECELAVIIGQRLNNATADEAKDAIFGYSISNDVSCDNVYGWDHHLARSKGADTFCVLGPWIETDFDPLGKTILGYQNNKLIRQGTCDQRFWSEPELLVWLSKWITLEPGDVVLTGAPGRISEKIYLQHGDSYSCVIDGIGELRNEFQVRQVD